MASQDGQSKIPQDLANSLGKFIQLLEKQMSFVQLTLTQAVDEVMQSIGEISSATGQRAKEANSVLEETYFAPDKDTVELIDTIQDAVDQVFEEAAKGSPAVVAEDPMVEKRLRRFGGKFSKHMEALSTLDRDMGPILIQMMGALSNDDVIRQKLDHLVKGSNLFGKSLGEALAKGIPNAEELHQLKSAILNATFKSYTCEDEKAVFRAIFGNDEAFTADKKQERRAS